MHVHLTRQGNVHYTHISPFMLNKVSGSTHFEKKPPQKSSREANVHRTLICTP